MSSLNTVPAACELAIVKGQCGQKGQEQHSRTFFCTSQDLPLQEALLDYLRPYELSILTCVSVDPVCAITLRLSLPFPCQWELPERPRMSK